MTDTILEIETTVECSKCYQNNWYTLKIDVTVPITKYIVECPECHYYNDAYDEEVQYQIDDYLVETQAE